MDKLYGLRQWRELIVLLFSLTPNLVKHVYSQVTTYIPEECDALHQLSKREEVDLQSIARGEPRGQPIDLLKWILFAASVSPASSQRLLPVIDSLPNPTKIALAEAVMRMQKAEEDLMVHSDEMETGSEADAAAEYDDSSDQIMSSPPRSSVKKDDLQYEAEIIALSRDKRALEAQAADLQAELDSLQAYAESLEERVTEANLGIGSKGQKEGSDEEVRRIRSEWDKDKDLISALEAQNEDLQKKFSAQERELTKLKEDGRSKQELRDEVQQLTIERDEMLPKARGFLNLQKKVQSQQDEMKALERQKDSLLTENQALKELEPLKEKFTILEKADHEKYNTIANNEQKIFEMKQYEKRLEHDLYVLGQSHESLKTVYERAQANVTELSERLQDVESSREPGSVQRSDDLAAELGEQDRQEEMLVLINGCEALITDIGNSLTKKPTTAAPLPADTSLLQRTIETLMKRCNNLEEQYLDVYEENLGLHETLRGKDVDTRFVTGTWVREFTNRTPFQLEPIPAFAKTATICFG